MVKDEAMRPRASEETFGQRLARRYLRAEFRGAEAIAPEPSATSFTTLNSYLASSRAARWFERWFWSLILLCCLAALCGVVFVLFSGSASGGVAVALAAFGLLLLAFTVHLQAGVRCMFRMRHAKRRTPRRRS